MPEQGIPGTKQHVGGIAACTTPLQRDPIQRIKIPNANPDAAQKKTGAEAQILFDFLTAAQQEILAAA